jgi:hypothetical protein
MKEMGMEWRNDKEVHDIGGTMEVRAPTCAGMPTAAYAPYLPAFHCRKIVEHYCYTEGSLQLYIWHFQLHSKHIISTDIIIFIKIDLYRIRSSNVMNNKAYIEFLIYNSFCFAPDKLELII